MPFSANRPEELPEPVQKLGKKERERWVNIWTSVRNKCLEDSDDVEACEAEAFRQANGVVFDDADKAGPAPASSDGLVFRPADTVNVTITNPTSEPVKAGRRNNRNDKKMIQDIHDKATGLGAECKMHDDYKDKPKKAIELQQHINRIRDAWYDQFTPDDDEMEMRPWYEMWVFSVPESFVVVAQGDMGLMEYPYFISEENDITFGFGQPVEMTFTPRKTANPLKAISKTEDELTVANYIALWGGRDLEGVVNGNTNSDGTRGEFFTKSTAFDSDYTAADAVIVDWEHGLQPEPDGPGADNPLGRVLWSTAKADGIGLWVKRVLNRRNKYVKMLEELIEAGLIGTSSEAIPDGVQKGQSGEIQSWPLRRDTLTVNPMEPRMLSENHLLALKALADEIPQIASVCEARGIELGSGDDGEEAARAACQRRAKAAKLKARSRLRLLALNEA